MLAGFLAIPFNVGMFGFIYILSAFRKHKAAVTPPPPVRLSRQEKRHPENASQAKKGN